MWKLSSNNNFVAAIVVLVFLSAGLNVSAVSVDTSLAEYRNETEAEADSRLEDLCKKFGSSHTMCLPKVGPDCGSGSVTNFL